MKRNFICILGIIICFIFSDKVYSQSNFTNELGSLATIKSGFKNKRLSSADPTGNNVDHDLPIKDGEKRQYKISGAGMITHIWMTIAPWDIMRNNIILRMYWNGNDYPSVESPIAAFFGNGWDEKYNFSSLPLAVGPQDGSGLVSYFKMPFSDGAVIEIENQTGRTIDCLYFYVDYLEMKSLPKDIGYFHAWYNHELTDALPEGETEWAVVGPMKENKDGANNYVFADIKGKGHFVGINYYVHCPTPMWYGEGDDMIFIDGESKASLLGTGTEDFFNTSWCPKTLFNHPYYGYGHLNNNIGWMGRTHIYRFFISDPVFFDKSFKGTIEHGHNNNLTLDLGTVAYWYQDTPGVLPAAPSKELRQPKPLINERDIHRWRHEWRMSKGNKSKLWGNEQ